MPSTKDNFLDVPSDAINEESSNNSSKSKKEGRATVPELTLQVVLEFYTKGADAPNQNQIVNRVTELKNNDLTSYLYEPKGQQPAVSRALKKLVAQKKIIKTDDNRYRPYNLETGRALLKEEIIKTVKFGKQSVFQISPTTWLLDIERSSIATAKNLFAQYLGPNCYNVLEFNGYLMLLFGGKIAEHKKLREEIIQIRKEALKKEKAAK